MSSQITSNVPQINLDDYEIKKPIYKSSYSYICKAIDKKTKREVAIKSFIYDEKISEEEIQDFIHEINVSCLDIPGLVKIIGYRFQLTEEERKKSKYTEFEIPGFNTPIDLTGLIIVMNYYKITDIYKPITDYLESNGSQHDLINPTIRSKIIFGVASTMKQFHAKNAINCDLQFKYIFLNDEFEPIISVFRFYKFKKYQFIGAIKVNINYSLAPELFMDGPDSYSFPVDVYAYGILLYRMFSTKIEFAGKKSRSQQQYMMWIAKGERPDRPENIPDHYWELIKQCWKQDPEERPSFEEITELLKNDKYALNEFGMKTNLDELHQYQDKIEGIKPKSTSKDQNQSTKTQKDLENENKQLKKRLQEYESLLSYPNQPKKDDNCFIDDEEEQKYHNVLEKVGEGATSITYKIHDTKSDQLMCKKVLKGSQDSQADFKNAQNAMKEFQVLYQLDHPCICKVLKINTSETVKDSNVKKGQEITTIAMFLEFLDFKLNEILKSGITNTLKARIVIEIAHAMKFIHNKGLIHRDLKVENIMLNSVYECKVVDFGLVRIHEFLDPEYSFVQDSLTRGVGTFAYMSPEMLNNEDYDYKTDVYSFGILLFYIFVGNLPKQNLKDKMNGKPIEKPSPSSSISKFCIELIQKCLLIDPKKRPSFDDIIKEIRKNNYCLASNIDKAALYHRDHELELFETK